MAAIPANTPLSNSYTNGNNRLPSGPCNYTNLNLAGNPKCGCLRFTDNAYLNTGPAGGVCVCEHHSCFHKHNPDDRHQVSAASMGGGLSHTPRQSAFPQAHAGPIDDMRVNIEVSQPPGFQSNTYQLGRYMKAGSVGSFPAIPSQCLLPSENGSRASSSQTGYARPFGGKGINTLNGVPRAVSDPANRSSLPLGIGQVMGHNGKSMQIYHDSNGHKCLQSLTEVATPSIQSQDLDAESEFNKDAALVQDALQNLADDVPLGADANMCEGPFMEPKLTDNKNTIALSNDPDREDLLPKIRHLMNHVADYPMTKRNFEGRLDQLENASFSHKPLEILQEDHDLLRVEVTELEGRVESVEKQQMAQTDNGSVRSYYANGSLDSRSSSALIASAIDAHRIEALESQILELQAVAPPCFSRPLDIEVVFLPFGRELRGIWSSESSTTQRSRMNSGSGDELTQTQQHSALAAAQARLTAHDYPVAWENLVSKSGSEQSPWLAPRSCGPNSVVYERLRSRGLVKTIQIRGPDARDVQAAMLHAFGDLPGTIAEDPFTSDNCHRSPMSVPRSLRKSLGLQHSWIPLRKVHKNSSLRFLNTTEMITPALWTVQFLVSSVAMRSAAGRRLFVTQSDSYTQDLGATTSWTWRKLRQLDRVYSDTGINHTPEADAHERCWEFNEHFDAHESSPSPPSQVFLAIRSSAQENESSLSLSLPSSARGSPVASTTPTSLPLAPLSSSLKGRQAFRPLQDRTVSLPSLVPIKSSPSQSTKRRITSFDSDIQSSPIRALAAIPISKRHRTRSPSHHRDTPRYSAGPPSPYAFAEDFERKRGTTPFAYATPHSNAPYVDPHRYSARDHDDEDEERGSTTDESQIGGDQNALSDYEAPEEDEWEGLPDDYKSENNFSTDMQDQELEYDSDGEDSCPSEYPSTQRQHEGQTTSGFSIHVDANEEEEYTTKQLTSSRRRAHVSDEE